MNSPGSHSGVTTSWLHGLVETRVGFGVLSHSRAVGFAFRLFIDAGGRREALARCSETSDVVTTGAGDRAPRSATSLPPGAQAPRCRRRGPVVAVHTPRAAFQQRSAGLGGNHRFYHEWNEKASLCPGENVTSSIEVAHGERRPGKRLGRRARRAWGARRADRLIRARSVAGGSASPHSLARIM